MSSLHPTLEMPSAWVSRFCARIAPGEVLDLACGGGRHARLLASAGLRVLAVDRDPAALARAAGPGISTLQLDLESGVNGFQWPFEAGRFSGIVVTNYLHRPLFPAMQDSLAPGGMLIYETFAQGNERYGKPSSPAFLLRAGELLKVMGKDMQIVAFEDGVVDVPRPARIQRLCAIKAPADAQADAVRLD